MNAGPAFRPPSDAASLFVGSVMHARLRPMAHRFTYGVFSLLLDLDRLAEADRSSPVFSIDRFNAVAVHQRDHGPRDGSPLRAWIDGILAPAGVDLRGGRVLLLCYPRILGYVFNPLSVYFCYDSQAELAAVVYEVRNTFGEHHTYVAPVRPGELTAAGLRQERDKLFYVSPFNPVAMRYRFRLRPPTDEVALRILAIEGDAPVLAATFSGDRRPLTTATLAAACARFPLLTAKVMGAIHWEALRLWIKGLRLVARPPAPHPLSYDGRAASAPPPSASRPRPAAPSTSTKVLVP